MYRKVVNILIVVATLCSCVSTYVPRVAKESDAILVIPAKEFSWQFFGGFSRANVFFGFPGENGCAFLKKAEQPSEKVSEIALPIPSDTEIIVSFAMNYGNTLCNVSGYFQPEPKATYKVMSITGLDSCRIGVLKMNGDAIIAPVTLLPTRNRFMTDQICKDK